MAKASIIRNVCRWSLFLNVVLFQIQNANCQDADDSVSMMPFCISFPSTLGTSQVIKITGSVSTSSSGRVTPAPWLNVIFSPECSSLKSQFFLRMKISNGTTITGNTFENGHWGEEISGKTISLPSTGQFVLLVAVQLDGYKVTASGVPLWTLPHRLSYTDVSRLSVRGASTDIQKIELIDQADSDPQRNTLMFYPVPLEVPVSNPTFPFWGYIPGGLQVGKAIRIKGYFPEGVQHRTRTTIDLCKDRIKGPIVLHIDIRFRYNMDTKRVVRNYKDHSWDKSSEERDGPFPFNIGENFIMLVQVQPTYYNISVNGVPCWTYLHRIHYEQANQLAIFRDAMTILEVAYIDTTEKEDTVRNLPSTGNAAMGTAVYPTPAYCTGISIVLFALVNHFLQMM